jgi:excisionase family DNA binding protein
MQRPGCHKLFDLPDKRYMDDNTSLHLSAKEIAASFSDPVWAERFPPVLTVQQVADLLQVPIATIYDWRSRGLLGSCCRKIGKHLRFYRDRLVYLVFNEDLHGNDK